MARKPLRPLIRSGGFYPSRKWTPLVYAGGYTTANGGEEPAPPPIEKTITGNPIHILDALAKPAQALSVKLEPVQDLHGYDSPWPAGGGKNLLWLNNGVFKTGGFRENRQLTGIGTWVGMSASNYLAPNNITSYTIGDNNLTVEAKSNGYGIGIECKVTAGQKYTLSWVGTNVYVGISFYDGDGAQLSYVTSGVSPKTFTVPESTANAIIVLRADAANVTGEFSNVQLEEGQTATAYAPYSNICPISGYSEAKVYVSPTQDAQDATVYTIDLDGARYGGTLDVTTGKLTVDRAMVTFDGSADETWTYSSSYAKTNTAVFYTSVLTDAYYPDWSNYRGYIINLFPNATRDYLYNNDVECMGFTGMAVASAFPTVRIFKTRASNETEFRSFLNNNPIQFVYELATPQTIQLTPQQVELLLGENNIWSDGEMTLTYLADGNASDEEALNILLGGRYVNNHSEDEPTDREALNIVLGGNER